MRRRACILAAGAVLAGAGRAAAQDPRSYGSLLESARRAQQEGMAAEAVEQVKTQRYRDLTQVAAAAVKELEGEGILFERPEWSSLFNGTSQGVYEGKDRKARFIIYQNASAAGEGVFVKPRGLKSDIIFSFSYCGEDPRAAGCGSRQAKSPHDFVVYTVSTGDTAVFRGEDYRNPKEVTKGRKAVKEAILRILANSRKK